MQIKNRYTDVVIWESPCSNLRESVMDAVKSGADLSRANLYGAELSRADLSGADLSRADLSRANLSGTDLSRADLSGTDLSRADLSRTNLSRAELYGANLSGANLSRANLSRANLSGADISRANLSGTDLSGADLSGAELSRAKLQPVRVDFISAVLNLPNELEFLRDTIAAGKIDGSTYAGECACLAGTFAHAKGIPNYNGSPIKNGRTFIADSSSPRERFFLSIKRGDTPENNGASRLALEWTNEAIAIRDNIRNSIAVK